MVLDFFISSETNKELCGSCTHGIVLRYHTSLHVWRETLMQCNVNLRNLHDLMHCFNSFYFSGIF